MKRALVGLTVLATALVLGLVLAPRGDAAEKGPIRIGLLTSKTGVLAIHGTHQMAAVEAFKDKYGTTVAGRKVEFYPEDDQSKVPLGVTKVRKLITGDKVHIVMGGLFASTGYAIAPLGDQYQTPIFVWSCPDDLSQRKRYKFVVKYFSCSQPQHAMAHWLRKNKPQVKKVIIFGPDYAFGYESSGGFQKVFEDMGGQLSFSAAILNDLGDGLVISCINGRQEARTYAKPVQRASSPYNLSPEEQEAIRLALAGVGR